MRKLITRRGAWLGLIMVILAVVGLRTATAWAAPSVQTQLAFVLDGSGSISASEFNRIKEGLAAAIGDASKVPPDGTVEIIVIQFADNINESVCNTWPLDCDPTGARVEVEPTVINSASGAQAVANQIRAISQQEGCTPMATGIALAHETLINSDSFGSAIRRVINIASDGNPNKPGNCISSDDAIPAALDARDAAVNDGIGLVDAEGTGSAVTETAFQNFLCALVWPQPPPSQPCKIITAPNLTGFPNPAQQGFVLLVQNLNDFAAAIAAKIQVIIPDPPIAEADGPYRCAPGQQTIQLDGTGSFDPDNNVGPTKGIVTFQWDLDNDGQFDDATGPTPTVNCPPTGSITVGLQVTDSDNLTGTDTAIVTRQVPPVAEAGGPYVCTAGQQTIQLNGTGSFDPDNNTGPTRGIVKYEWDLDNDGQFDDAVGATPTVPCPPSGAATVALKVTDSDDLSDTDTSLVRRQTPPVAQAGGPYVCNIGQTTIPLDGTGSFDPDHNVGPTKGIVTFQWDLDNNGTFEVSNTATPTAACPPEGTSRTVTLRVTDSDNLTDADTATIEAIAACQPPPKVDDQITELLKKGVPFKDLFADLAAELLDAANDLLVITSSVDPAATRAELRMAQAQLQALDKLADFFGIFLAQIEAAKFEYICEINALVTALQGAIAQKKFGQKTGTKIIKQLDSLKKALERLNALLAALKTKLTRADQEIAMAIAELGVLDAEDASAHLAKAQKLVHGAFLDVDRMLRKVLSEVLKIQKTIATAFKIEKNNRIRGKKKTSELGVSLEDRALVVRGTKVREITVNLYTLSGRLITQAHGRDERLSLETLTGHALASGVYLYTVRVLDADGRSWQSELEKLVWIRH